MSVPKFLVFFTATAAADVALQRWMPGLFWLTPALLIATSLIGVRPRFILIVLAILADLGSGLRFGWITMALTLMIVIPPLAASRVRIGADSAWHYFFFAGLLAILFLTLMIYPVGARTILAQAPNILLSSLIPLVLAYEIA